MKVLVACEESQAVTKELRRLGHEAYSCDILPPSGGHPEWHIQEDCLPLLKGYCGFNTLDGTFHLIDGKWDMIIAFPPCTDLSSSGARWFEKKRKDGRQKKAIDFFMNFVNADCERIAIENPIGVMSTYYRKPDQKIQPYQFGEADAKTTCLWIIGDIPLLVPTKILKRPTNGWNNQHYTEDGRYVGFRTRDDNGKVLSWNDPRTARIRSKTYPGIAKAMAEQWAGVCYD